MLTDFGLARDVDTQSRMTRSGTTLGTPQYMPPEQAKGELAAIGPASDIYSLGATLYEMLTLEPPFRGANVLEVLHNSLIDDPVPPRKRNPEIDRDLEVICLKCLEKPSASRYADARTLAEDLRRYRRGDSILAKPPAPLERFGRWARKQRIALVSGFVAFLLAGGVGLALFLNLGGGDPPPPKDLTPLLKAAGRMDEGRKALEQARKCLVVDDPGTSRRLLDRALKAFSEACTLNPRHALAFSEKGKVLALLKRSDEALEAFGKALALQPDLTDAYFGRVKIRYVSFTIHTSLTGEEATKKDREEIQADLERIREIGRKAEIEHWGIALFLSVDGKPDLALQEIEKSLAANKTFPDAYALRGSLRLNKAVTSLWADKKRLLEGALEDYTTAIRLAGEDTDYRIMRIQILLYLEREREALREADALVAALHDNAYAYLLRAQVHLALGDKAAYGSDMDRADALPFPNPELHLTAAAMVLGGFQAWRLGSITDEEIRRGLTHIQRLLDEHPERTEVLAMRGLLRMLAGEK
ncbi:MAG: protein kinase domain-containing protein, partial [Planctomycetota bacterium]